MFSDHLQKIDQVSGRTLFLIAAGLVIFCQLVAMVLVTQGQVEKAEAREQSYASARAAAAWCIESSQGVALKNCDLTMLPAGQAAANVVTTPEALSQVTLISRN